MSDNQDLNELESKILELEKQNVKLTQRGLKVREENDLLKSSKEIALKKADFEYQLQVAERMIKSGAFPRVSPEQAWVLMKAGSELGLTELESMTDLYIVNGSVQFHSKGLVKRFTSNGYKISFEDETDKGVTVIVSKNEERYVETVSADDQILKKSKVMGFAKKNKMRYHGLRMIGNFYLPHLFGSINSFEIEETPYVEVETINVSPEIQRLETLIEEYSDKEDLERLEEDAKLVENKQIRENLLNKLNTKLENLKS